VSDWGRWLLVAIALVLILALVVYARGEQQRGDSGSATSSVTLDLAEHVI